MAVKQSVANRRARRLARKNGGISDALPGTADAGSLPPSSIPHQAVTDPPSGNASSAMAGGGEDIVRGNSNLQPMNAKGHSTIQHVGADLARLGGPDEITPSTSERAMETGQDVASVTGAPMAPPTPGLESHAMGQLEGEQKTPEVKRFLADLIRKAPNFRIPGQGALSNRPSESFNEFKQRVIGALRGLMQKLAGAPQSRIVVPTSTQVIKLAKAWCAAGCPDDLRIDNGPMLKGDGGKPGEMERLFPEPSGRWEVTPFSPATATEFLPGIYFLRHGETDSVQAQHATKGQELRAQLIGHIRAGDYGSAQKAARQAASGGHMTDDEISAAIDESLPTADEANGLPPDQLLNAASAASPAKRAELLPVLQRTFGNISGVSPDGQHRLRSHLGRLGVQV